MNKKDAFKNAKKLLFFHIYQIINFLCDIVGFADLMTKFLQKLSLHFM